MPVTPLLEGPSDAAWLPPSVGPPSAFTQVAAAFSSGAAFSSLWLAAPPMPSMGAAVLAAAAAGAAADSSCFASSGKAGNGRVARQQCGPQGEGSPSCWCGFDDGRRWCGLPRHTLCVTPLRLLAWTQICAKRPAHLTCGPGCVKQLYTRQRRQKLAEHASRPPSKVLWAPAACAACGGASGGMLPEAVPKKSFRRVSTTPVCRSAGVRRMHLATCSRNQICWVASSILPAASLQLRG